MGVLTSFALVYSLITHFSKASPKSTVPSKNTSAPKRILFSIFVGKTKERQEIPRKNLRILNDRLKYKHKYEIDCLVFSYAQWNHQPKWLKLHTNPASYCKAVTLYESNYVVFLKFLQPWLLKKAGYDFLMITVDDVIIHGPRSTFDLETYLDLVVARDLAVATPAIWGSPHTSLQPQLSFHRRTGRWVDAVEVQSTTFRLDAWECWYEMIDTEFPSGWGTDVWFWGYCVTSGKLPNAKLGIIDTQTIVHTKLPSTNAGTNPSYLMEAQVASWAKERNITLARHSFNVLGYF